MRILGIIASIFGGLWLLVSILTIVGNADLDIPGPTLIDWPGGWRLVLGIILWSAAVWISIALMAFTRVTGLAWLMLLAFVVLFPLYLALGGLLTTALAVIAVIVVLGVVVPIGVWLAARAISRAVVARRAARRPAAAS